MNRGGSGAISQFVHGFYAVVVALPLGHLGIQVFQVPGFFKGFKIAHRLFASLHQEFTQIFAFGRGPRKYNALFSGTGGQIEGSRWGNGVYGHKSRLRPRPFHAIGLDEVKGQGQGVRLFPFSNHVNPLVGAAGRIVHGNALFEIPQIERAGQPLFRVQFHLDFFFGPENALVHVGVDKENLRQFFAVGAVGHELGNFPSPVVYDEPHMFSCRLVQGGHGNGGQCPNGAGGNGNFSFGCGFGPRSQIFALVVEKGNANLNGVFVIRHGFEHDR